MPQTFLSTLSLRRATVYDSKQMHRLLISIHTLLAESDLLQSGKMSQQQLFLSTLSLRRATRVVLYIRVSTDISIHALLAESDQDIMVETDKDIKFLSTLSLRRATQLAAQRLPKALFLSTLSLRRATMGYPVSGQHYSISIHALLAESDGLRDVYVAKVTQFLSTLSLRRATPGGPGPRNPHLHFYPRSPCGERLYWDTSKLKLGDFYPRSPCGERRKYPLCGVLRFAISIHALLAESDRERAGKAMYNKEFLSTLSLRRATFVVTQKGPAKAISIHALLAESDAVRCAGGAILGDFYPRSPCGERRCQNRQDGFRLVFLSTLSLRRATPLPPLALPPVPISIHALLAESDGLRDVYVAKVTQFLSTLSLRRATY